MSLLEIKDLCASAKEKRIINGLNLKINKGEIHVIMGPNGAGKSTLANIIMNNPQYKINSGDIIFEGNKINDLSVDERAKRGIFMSFQTPEEVPGISVTNFLKTAKGAITNEPVKIFAFKKELEENMKKLKMETSYCLRDLNVGFSGGEKKKNEILQLLTLNPKFAILDEIDSGLDVDAIKIVAKGINIYKNDNNAILIITHSTKLLKDLKVDFVHVLVDGKIVKTGSSELTKIIEKEGYENFK